MIANAEVMRKDPATGNLVPVSELEKKETKMIVNVEVIPATGNLSANAVVMRKDPATGNLVPVSELEKKETKK